MQILLYLFYALAFVIGAYVLFLSAILAVSILCLRRAIRDRHDDWSRHPSCTPPRA